MRRNVICLDNAVTETPFGSLKAERLRGEQLPAIGAAKDEAPGWLLWPNPQPMHSTLNYVSPARFEQDRDQAHQSHGADGPLGSMEDNDESVSPTLPTNRGNRPWRIPRLPRDDDGHIIPKILPVMEYAP